MTMHHFNERHPAFKGFSEVYHKDISPYQGQVGGRFWQLDGTSLIVAGLVLYCIFCVLFYFVFSVHFGLCLIGSAALLVISFIVYDMNKYPEGLETDYELIRKIAAFVGIYSSAEKNPLLLFRALGLIPFSKTQDVTLFNLTGEYNGTTVNIMDVKLYDRSDSGELVQPSRILMFEGHLIRLEIAKSFSGQTIVRRDQGIGQAKQHQDLKRVGLVDPVFERIFEVYGSDQVESRALISPDLMQEILDLERITRGKNIEFGFIAGQLLIKLSRPMKDIRESLESGDFNITTTQNLIDEISCIFDIVDTITR